MIYDERKIEHLKKVYERGDAYEDINVNPLLIDLTL